MFAKSAKIDSPGEVPETKRHEESSEPPPSLTAASFVPAGKTRLMLLAADYATLLIVALVFVFLVLSGQ